MKLFLRDHTAFILISLLQVMLILLICWLDGFHDVKLIFYSLAICTLTFICYLTYRYYTLFPFYRRLSCSLRSLDESTQSYGVSPLGEALTDLLQAQYRYYQERLLRYKRRQEMHTTFINQWVHQMKTPLSVITLITQQEDDPRFESIREEAERLQKGLEMVLYAARLDAFERDFRVEPVELRKIIYEVVQENKRLFIRNKVYPEVEVDSDLLVISDEKWLVFILDQLVTNAIKYSSGSRERISLSTTVKDDRVELVVCDHGIGILPQDLPRIFEPYFTGENGRTHRQSTGMGLYLVHQACQELEHPIIVESEVGKGTIVRLTFFRRSQSYKDVRKL